jgi:S1-C subfamily serine protease
VIAQISDAPRTTEAWLGIAFSSVDSESAAVQLGLDSSTRGAAVTEVYPGCPGDAADLAVGDVIVAADDVPISNASALTRLIASRKVGDDFDLELDRQPRPAPRRGVSWPGGRPARYRMGR